MLSIIVDTDAIIAQVLPFDANHNKSMALSLMLEKEKAYVKYPNITIVEAVTTLHRKFNAVSKALEIARYFEHRKHLVVDINYETLKSAINIFTKTKSKKNTLFDCIVCSVAKEQKTDAIFSFDKFYNKMGFKLASDLKL